MWWFVVMLHLNINFVEAVKIWLVIRLKNLLFSTVLSFPPLIDVVCYSHEVIGVQNFRLSCWTDLDAVVK